MAPFWIILIASVVSMLVGGVWYSPLILGKRWAKLKGIQFETKIEIERPNLIHRNPSDRHVEVTL